MILPWVGFIRQLMPVLVDLGRLLFERHKGDAEGAIEELKRIPDHWAGIEDRRAAVDKELEELEAAEDEPEAEKPG